jgi:hypothetical protein
MCLDVKIKLLAVLTLWIASNILDHWRQEPRDLETYAMCLLDACAIFRCIFDATRMR